MSILTILEWCLIVYLSISLVYALWFHWKNYNAMWDATEMVEQETPESVAVVELVKMKAEKYRKDMIWPQIFKVAALTLLLNHVL